MLRSFRFALALTVLVPFVGCAPEAPNDPEEEATESREPLSVPYEVLNVTKSNAQVGLTVLKTKAQYKDFFGVAAPSSINFNSSWVVHYSMGVENTGGYAAQIKDVARVGSGASKKLVITTEDVSPGPNCAVTQSLTNPQITVKIKKQTGYATDQVQTYSETDCSEPNWCLGKLCAVGKHCDELVDSCVDDSFCAKVKCTAATECDEQAKACVPRHCDPSLAADCGTGFACENHIACITVPCPTDYRCYPSDPCQGISWAGVCDGATLKYCESQQLHVVDCSTYGGGCAWNQSSSYYDCN